MAACIEETNHRREVQLRYNEEHGITPTPIRKERNLAGLVAQAAPKEERAYTETRPELAAVADPVTAYMSADQLRKSIENTRRLMQEASKRLDFMEAAQYRDELLRMEELLKAKV